MLTREVKLRTALAQKQIKESSERISALTGVEMPPEPHARVRRNADAYRVISLENIATFLDRLAAYLDEPEAQSDDAPPLDDAPPTEYSLRDINGLGPKSVKALAQLGVETVETLAHVDPAELETRFAEMNVTGVAGRIEGWVEQAQAMMGEPEPEAPVEE